ncbi:MAG: hypothetical protein NVS9B15_12040 [Acidobacteriaceae bacterium]
MDAQSDNRGAGLPNEGQPVEFVLEGRDVPIAGTYVAQTFRSRWSAYSVERVRSWWSAAVTERSSAPTR